MKNFPKSHDLLFEPDANETTLSTSVVPFHGWGSLQSFFYKRCLAEVHVRHWVPRPTSNKNCDDKTFLLPLSFVNSASFAVFVCLRAARYIWKDGFHSFLRVLCRTAGVQDTTNRTDLVPSWYHNDLHLTIFALFLFLFFIFLLPHIRDISYADANYCLHVYDLCNLYWLLFQTQICKASEPIRTLTQIHMEKDRIIFPIMLL